MPATATDQSGTVDTATNVREGECILPFTFKRKLYKGCAPTKRGNICATSVKRGKNRTLKTYAYCQKKLSKKKTLKLPRRLKDIGVRVGKTEKFTLFPADTSKERIKGKKIETKTPKTGRSKDAKKTVRGTVHKEKASATGKEPQKIETKFPKAGKSKDAAKTVLRTFRGIQKGHKIETFFPRKASKKESEKESETEKVKTMTPKKVIVVKGKRKKVNIVAEAKPRVLNQEFIKLLGRLEELMTLEGEVHRARAYHNAIESIYLYPHDITSVDQIKGLPNIGKTILAKLQEYLDTGTLRKLEQARGKPRYLFARVFGIGPKRAKTLVQNDGVATLDELRERQDELLNTIQKIGLKYFEDIQERIPRKEVEEYERVLREVFDGLKHAGSRFKIVGSYRRGAKTSGDIDVLVTNDQNDRSIFHKFIDALKEKGILVELLSKGRVKSLTIGQLTGMTPRRLDFLYANPTEYAFGILYFTGSKPFNVVMRQRAIDMGYTMNEHGLYKLVEKKKGARVDLLFPTEGSIFDFLGLVYKTPVERVDGRAVVLKSLDQPLEEVGIIAPPKVVKKKNGTLKIKKSKRKTPRVRLLELAKEGIDSLSALSEDQLSAMIRYASSAYYNDKPVISDSIFDILKEHIESHYPDNLAIAEIGAPPIGRNKVDLPYFLGSMEKIKPDTKALRKWKAKFKGPYEISGKLDGISALYTTEGDQPRLYTRGGATKGLDISHLIPHLQVPQEKGIAIRGELIIAVDTFKEKYEGEGKGKYKSARNFVSGVATSKTREPGKWKDIDLVAYEVIKPSLKPSEQMEWLEGHDIITVVHREEEEITNELLSTILLDWRSNYKYEVDGIIVSDDRVYPRTRKNPEHSFAFKMIISDQTAEVKVLDVLYTPTKDGYLAPVVRVEKVRIRGADIEYASAHHARFIVESKIGIGAVILLRRSGDVIPKIEAVITPAAEPKLPDVPWKWNATRVDAILENVEDSPEVRERNIEFFFKKIKTEGLGPGNVRKIIAAGFDSVPKILKASKQDLLTVKGFKDATVNKIYGSIQERLQKVSLPRLMAATNVFGRGLGRQRADVVLKVHPSILTDDLTRSQRIELVRGIRGFEVKTARIFADGVAPFLEFVAETGLKWKLKQEPEEVVDKSHPLYGKKIGITGFSDQALQERLEALGADVSRTVTKNTFLVLVEDEDEDTGKAEKARGLGIPLVTPKGLIQEYLS